MITHQFNPLIRYISINHTVQHEFNFLRQRLQTGSRCFITCQDPGFADAVLVMWVGVGADGFNLDIFSSYVVHNILSIHYQLIKVFICEPGIVSVRDYFNIFFTESVL
ncbi:hypothetical protein CJ20_303 [Escherichia phage CJ20]|nr:hypothetical protein CJ20_303 [Escherichia phage CJ20]